MAANYELIFTDPKKLDEFELTVYTAFGWDKACEKEDRDFEALYFTYLEFDFQ